MACALTSNAAATTAASAMEIDEFINGALVTWLESCLPDPTVLSGYSALLDGTLIHNVWLQIDPEPQHNPLYIKERIGVSLSAARVKNFECIVRNLIALFEEEFGQTILVLPDTITLGYQPETKSGLEQMKLLLTLLLGAAVQCPNKEIFIARIKELDVDTQHAIMEYIKQVTDNNSLVLQKETVEQLNTSALYNHLVRLTKERDNYYLKFLATVCTEPTDMSLTGGGGSGGVGGVGGSCNDGAVNHHHHHHHGMLPLSPSSNMTASSPSSSTNSETNHMAVELADLKSRIRKLRQELEEKAESQIELKEELEYKNVQYEKLRIESQEWYTEAKRAVAYRDEVDVLRERADRADRLEIEVQKLRDKLADAEFYKTRVEEIKEDNRLLLETKEMVEEQLLRLRKRTEHAKALESELNHYKQKYDDLMLEHQAKISKIDELLEQNTQLQLIAKDFNTSQDLSRSSDIEDDCNSGDNSLSEQLTNSAQTRAIKLELENKRLLAALDQLKESSLHEATNQIQELEEEKKKLNLKSEQMQENISRLTARNVELEDVLKSTLEVNQKLQDTLDDRQKQFERQSEERELERNKLQDLLKHVDTLNKDKQRIQTLNASLQRRADDVERLAEAKTKEIEDLKEKSNELDEAKEKLYDLNAKISTYERENGSLVKEVAKLKENLEEKAVLLDKELSQRDMQTKEMQRLSKELEIAEQIQTKFAELEKQNQELISQRDIDLETIETLRKDLVTGTLATNKVRHNLEKLGLSVDQANENGVELNVETVVEKLVRNPETFKTVRAIMLNVSREQQQQQQQQQQSNGNAKSDICVLCHRKEVFTVEKNIEISKENHEPPQELSIEHKVSAKTMRGGLVRLEYPMKANTQQKQQQQADDDDDSDVELQRLNEQNAQLQAHSSSLQTINEQLQAEKARLSVDVATLGSQITSLNTQHVALQLANSQLAADKDLLLKQVDSMRQEHKDLLQDQLTLQCLHEQLSAEYEALCKDKEQLKGVARDLRTEARELRDRITGLEKRLEDLTAENVAMKSCAKSLAVLQAEHLKLTEDFRSLFAASDRFKIEYKNIQEQYKNVRAEKMKLLQQHAELADELNAKAEQNKVLEIEFAKVSQRCEMLSQLNSEYDSDRKTLMENVSQLLSQYHELLSHSLEDKQHFHEEEKSYAERVHNLSRQKEKLEEKIMEHYKKAQTAPKKKPFASSLVRRVKKASSDLMNIVPSRNRRSWVDDTRNVPTPSMTNSESCGNDSDNSAEEQLSTASDTHLLQRNIPMRQSLQRLEPPDVTGSSLTLGTAGSRRTVYLIDENQKIPDTSSSSNATQQSSTVTAATAAVTNTSSLNSTSSSNMSNISGLTTNLGMNISSNISISGSSIAEPQTPIAIAAANILNASNIGTKTSTPPPLPALMSSSLPPNAKLDATKSESVSRDAPSTAGGGGGGGGTTTTTSAAAAANTFLMYNRINTMIGTNSNGLDQQNAATAGSRSGGDKSSSSASNSAAGGVVTPTAGGVQDDKLIRKRTEDKSNSIWYEYGCV